ncbi:RDD family protein [Lederbergia galactosidilytica]|uniref:RDD domain containing protein n=2 Tax=Lederbergia galactosidilytica TaxID=217031 RepID=A0A177ZW78_9BACI|nr:RDD family protein [Lederbergia galactosidilytica]KRG12041.1 RDD domain containing protein [Virgibacillus soli]MBP1913505.1 putative RDD family membrane protein YckC [Lederbergia galactosidilytica]OAK72175.1 RDD domain containing protein [Lederbergia galactosidilytica]
MDKEKVGVKTPEYISLQFQLAGLGSRTVAFIIDNIIISIAMVIIMLVGFLLVYAISEIPFMSDAISYLFVFMIIGLFLLNYGYFVVLEFFWGGKTIGKKIMGIRVIQENGQSITFLSSFIRNLLLIIDSLPYYLVGLLMVFFHPKKKRLGDLLAGTIVVYDENSQSKKKQSLIEKEIHERGLTKESLSLDTWNLKSMDMKDWNLIRTYANRFKQLDVKDRLELTDQVAEIIFPKLGLEWENKDKQELENMLLVVYLHLKEEWEYEG